MTTVDSIRLISKPLSPAAHPELLALARRLFWWKAPEEALARPARFLAQVMALGTWSDVLAARVHWTDDDLREVLRNPPAGVFDVRSCSYWHAVLGMGPAPRLPSRFGSPIGHDGE